MALSIAPKTLGNTVVSLLVLLSVLVGSALPIPASASSIGTDALNTMGARDYLLDQADLKDKTVAIQGLAFCVTVGVCEMIDSPDTFMQGVSFDEKGLSRNDRAKLLSCQDFMTACPATVVGHVVVDEYGLTSFVVLQIRWDGNNS